MVVRRAQSSSMAALAVVALGAMGCAQGGSRSDGGENRPPLAVDGGDDAGAAARDAGPAQIDPSSCTAYRCPAGMTLEAAGDTGSCRRVIEMRPAMARRYCHYLATYGVLGFSWIPASLPYECPAGMESAPNDTTGYCLYRDVTPPDGFAPACEHFETTGELGFTFPCDL